MNEEKMNELRYGKGILTEKDIVIECIAKITRIESVININGLDFIHQYLRDRFMKLREK